MIAVIIVLFVFSIYFIFSRQKRLAHQRICYLCDEQKEEINWAVKKNRLSILNDRLGKAGFFSDFSRICFYAFSILLFLGCLLALVTFLSFSISLFISLYLTALITLMYLRIKAQDVERDTLFKLPLFLESVILLVESGLGVLPAVQNTVLSAKNKNETVIQIMQAVYELSSSGLPFAQALELVANSIESKPLRHVLLHLDISSNEGGALIPSLRSLADYAHQEWKLGVETRVKKLENAVVFPVFAAVLGLMLLVVAVPVVPVVDFFNGLEQQKKLDNLNNKVGVFK